jgi:hypothetical protein
MPATRAVTAPAAGVYRVARSVDVFAFHLPQPLPAPAPAPIEEGNRWDDAHGRFATVYCASSAEGAFGEVIARYRERPGLLQRIDAFLTGRPDPEYDPLLSPGAVPAEFVDRRWLGHVGIDPAVRFVDVRRPLNPRGGGRDAPPPVARLRGASDRPQHVALARPACHQNDRQSLPLARANP